MTKQVDKPDQYRILLSEAGDSTEVKVLNKDGETEKSRSGEPDIDPAV